MVGVATAGRPVARAFDDGYTLEVNRTCTDGTRNANSMLYGAIWRAGKAMGYRRCITYTQADETGASLRAKRGWVKVKELAARASWAESSVTLEGKARCGWKRRRGACAVGDQGSMNDQALHLVLHDPSKLDGQARAAITKVLIPYLEASWKRGIEAVAVTAEPQRGRQDDPARESLLLGRGA